MPKQRRRELPAWITTPEWAEELAKPKPFAEQTFYGLGPEEIRDKVSVGATAQKTGFEPEMGPIRFGQGTMRNFASLCDCINRIGSMRI